MTRIDIDPEDLSTVVHGLRIAAERFDADAETCRQVPGHERLAEQFVRQAADSRAIASAIEDQDDREEIYVPAAREQNLRGAKR